MYYLFYHQLNPGHFFIICFVTVENPKVADIVNYLWELLEAILHFHLDDRLFSMITDQVVDKLINAYLAGLRKGDPLFSVKTIKKSLLLISAVHITFARFLDGS